MVKEWSPNKWWAEARWVEVGKEHPEATPWLQGDVRQDGWDEADRAAGSAASQVSWWAEGDPLQPPYRYVSGAEGSRPPGRWDQAAAWAGDAQEWPLQGACHHPASRWWGDDEASAAATAAAAAAAAGACAASASSSYATFPGPFQALPPPPMWPEDCKGNPQALRWVEFGAIAQEQVAAAAAEAWSKEAMWESWAYFDQGRRQFDIAMAGWGMEDQDIKQWCDWFRAHVESIGARFACEQRLTAREVNFSDNHLTGIGVQTLLTTLLDTKVVVRVLKLHHNRLDEGGGVADYLCKCNGMLWEVHLSHNRLGTAAALEILVGAASATDETGALSYPYRAGCRGATPLWLRIERNFIHCDSLLERAEMAARRLGRPNQVVCLGNLKGCGPHTCGKHRERPPATHAKNLSWQRLQEWMPQDCFEETKCTQSAQEHEVPSVYGGTKQRPGSHDSDETVDQWSKSEANVDQADETATNTEPLQADVLRWSEGKLRWVRDVIQIAPPPGPRTPCAPLTDSTRETSGGSGKSYKEAFSSKLRPDGGRSRGGGWKSPGKASGTIGGGGESTEVMAQNLRTMIGIQNTQEVVRHMGHGGCGKAAPNVGFSSPYHADHRPGEVACFGYPPAVQDGDLTVHWNADEHPDTVGTVCHRRWRHTATGQHEGGFVAEERSRGRSLGGGGGAPPKERAAAAVAAGGAAAAAVAAAPTTEAVAAIVRHLHVLFRGDSSRSQESRCEAAALLAASEAQREAEKRREAAHEERRWQAPQGGGAGTAAAVPAAPPSPPPSSSSSSCEPSAEGGGAAAPRFLGCNASSSSACSSSSASSASSSPPAPRSAEARPWPRGRGATAVPRLGGAVAATRVCAAAGSVGAGPGGFSGGRRVGRCRRAAGVVAAAAAGAMTSAVIVLVAAALW